MVEIAICLAIIGIGLVAIIGVLPLGITVQRDNREETLIDQDATVFLENIRNGARGLDDLTNYVFAISNYQTPYTPNPGGTVAIGYTNGPGGFLTNGANIIGLLSTPEYTTNGLPIPNLVYGGYSNYVVAYVHSISGPAVEKPPQDNDIIRGDSFSYKLICQNVPVAINTPLLWAAQPYNAGTQVLYNQIYWRAIANTAAGDIPSLTNLWVQDTYAQQLAVNLHELRLTFLWPLLPGGGTGNGRQTFRTMVAGQVVRDSFNTNLYFLQSQSFTNAP